MDRSMIWIHVWRLIIFELVSIKFKIALPGQNLGLFDGPQSRSRDEAWIIVDRLAYRLSPEILWSFSSLNEYDLSRHVTNPGPFGLSRFASSSDMGKGWPAVSSKMTMRPAESMPQALKTTRGNQSFSIESATICGLIKLPMDPIASRTAKTLDRTIVGQISAA